MNKFTWEEFEGLEGFYYAYYDKVELGFIEFWKPWKKWVWNQNENVVMSLDCMEEVCKKLKSFKEEMEQYINQLNSEPQEEKE